MRCQKKYIRLQFSVSGSAIQSVSKHTYCLHPDWIWKYETQNWMRIYFFWHRHFAQKKFLRFDPTLSSNNSGLNCRIKNHHIFGKGRSSAFIWHPWIPLKKQRKNVCVCILLVHYETNLHISHNALQLKSFVLLKLKLHAHKPLHHWSCGRYFHTELDESPNQPYFLERGIFLLKFT